MLYLARWAIDDSEGLNDLIPDLGPDTLSMTFAALDMRGTDDRQAGNPADATSRGWAVCWTGEQIVTSPGKIIRLGDHPDDVSVAALNQLRNRLGWNPDRGLLPNRLGDLIFELALFEADDADGSLPNLLTPNSANRREVKLGPHLIGSEPVPSSVGAAYTDDFNRTDEVLSAGSWAEIGSSALDIVSNQATHGGSTGVRYVAYDGGDSSTDAQYCEVDATYSGYQQLGVQVRMLNSHANASGYMAYWQGDTSNLVRLRYTNTSAPGGRTTLATTTGISYVKPTVRVEVDGSALEAFLDGVSEVTTTDTTYAGASTRRSGGLYSYDTSQTMDNFAFGDFGAASYTGTASVPVTVSASGTGQRSTSATASVPVTAAVAATGQRSTSGTASVPVVSSVAATGGVTRRGTATIPVTVSVAATGTGGSPVASGVAAVEMALSIAATGQRTTAQSVSVAVGVSFGANGSKTSTGTASVPVALSVAATGTTVPSFHNGYGTWIRLSTSITATAAPVDRFGSAVVPYKWRIKDSYGRRPIPIAGRHSIGTLAREQYPVGLTEQGM